MNRPTFLIIDGHSLAFRSYYAFSYRSDGGLRTSTGIPTSVCFGFLKSLLDILAKEQPQAVAIAFDLGIPTFRHIADSSYKANRVKTPEDFITDLENLQAILQAMNLKIVTVPGFEADDVIGTISQTASKEGYLVKILSGDQDLFQLVDEEKNICVLHLSKADQIQEFHSVDVETKLGILPTQVIDFKALCGDSSDNIAGVKGIGEKTAAKLLKQYDNLDNIFASLIELQNSTRKKLEEGIASAYHSRKMARIILDVPVSVPMGEFQLQGFDRSNLIPLLQNLEFNAFIRKIDDIQQKMGGTIAPLITVESEEEMWFDFQEEPQSETLEKITLDVQIINSVEKLQNLRDQFKLIKTPIAWDTESTSLNPHEAIIVGISCCWGSSYDQVAYIPLSHREGKNIAVADFRDAFQEILEDSNYPKVMQNAKFDRLILRTIDINLQGLIFDTMLASYVLDPETFHSLSDLSAHYLKLATQTYQDLVGKQKSIAEISIKAVSQYSGMDAYTTLQLMPILRAQLVEIPALWHLFQNVEIPLEKVLADMEWTGISIDREYLNNFSQELELDLGQIANHAYQIVEREFNLNSPKQLAEILIEKLGVNFTKKSRKTANGYSTDVVVLNKLAGEHPLIDIILEHRTLAKLKSTYVDALPSLVVTKTKRVHTDYNQANTATGRLSSSHPNLQNIPIRTAFSRRIRAAFLPEPGWSLLAADYSQIELRILAHLSQEPALIRAYNEEIDVHTLTAQLLLEKEHISSEERRLAKIINYGVIYGMGAQKFSRETGISTREAKQFIDAFEKRYAQIFAYMRSVEMQAESDGFVTTVLGRRRYFKELKYTSGQRKAALKRSAVNAPIQGTSADIIKLAMIQLHNLLQNFEARLLLQVHDELVFEIPPQELAILQPKIKEVMESVLPLSVPLVVDIHTGKNWMDTKA